MAECCDQAYFCPRAGENECGVHGGFDVCCDRPDLHRAVSCEFCHKETKTWNCCSSHNKHLCHACYRVTHFVEICGANCDRCAAENLAQLFHAGKPVYLSPERPRPRQFLARWSSVLRTRLPGARHP